VLSVCVLVWVYFLFKIAGSASLPLKTLKRKVASLFVSFVCLV